MAISLGLRSLVLMIVALLAGTGFYLWNNRSISGTYINQSAHAVHMLRLVQTDGGKLSGQFENVILSEDGKITDGSASLEGTSDGKNINLLIHFTSLLPVPVTASGVRDGSSIVLTIGITTQAPITREYIASNLEAFQATSNALREKSQKILADKATAKEQAKRELDEQKAISNVKNFASKLQEANTQFDNILSKPTVSDKKYRAITQQLQAYLQKIQGMPGSRFQYQRSQIVYAMNQGTYASNQIHYHVESGLAAINQMAKPLLNAVPEAKQICELYANELSATVTCLRLKTANEAFHDKGKQVQDRLNTLEQIYQTEYKTQQELIQQAEHIQ